MDTFDVFTYEADNGMRMILDCHAKVETLKTKATMAASVGVASPVQQVAVLAKKHLSQIKAYLKVYEVLNHPSIHAAAIEAKLSLTTVLDVAHAVYPLRKHKNRTELIAKLCGMLAGLDADTAKHLMTSTIRGWAGASSNRCDSACMHKKVGKDGKRRFVALLSPHIADRINTVLHELAQDYKKADPDLQYDEACGKAFIQKMLGTANSKQEPVRFGPLFMIATDHRFHADGTITTTDGTLTSLSDVANEELSSTGWAAVTGTTDDNPTIPLVGGLVKVRNRFASSPQRLAAILESLVCAWPDCDMPAARCQTHHIHAYSRGGLTTGDNLVPLCKKHNGENDDNPNKPCNGRIEKHPTTGRPGLKLNPNAPLIFNSHPVVDKTIIAYHHKHKP